MAEPIRITVDDKAVQAALQQLLARSSDLTRPMADIGEHLTETTKRRFATSTGPDGERWAPNTEVTILRYLGAFKSSFTKSGAQSKKGAARAGAKKPLIGETRSLSTTIFYSATRDSVEVGSGMEYAAVQQFGAKARQFGRAPWGDIPPRPFLGVSPEDTRSILDIVAGYLTP